MKVTKSITQIYIELISKLENHIINYGLSKEFNVGLVDFSNNIEKTTLHNIKLNTKIKEINSKEYLDNLNLIKACIWSQGIQLQPNQKKGITYIWFKKLCILLNQEIKRLSNVSNSSGSNIYHGSMINYRLNMSCDEEYTLLEESENKKLFLGKKYGHRVYYINDPEMGWHEVTFCDFMSHPIEFK